MYVVTTNRPVPDVEDEDCYIVFLVDTRPITCGLTWGYAINGKVNEVGMLRHCQAHCPPGYTACVSGGRRDVFGNLRVFSGEVLSVDFVREGPGEGGLMSRHAGTPSDRPPDDGDSSNSDSSSSDESQPARSVRARTQATGQADVGSARTLASALPQLHRSGPANPPLDSVWRTLQHSRPCNPFVPWLKCFAFCTLISCNKAVQFSHAPQHQAAPTKAAELSGRVEMWFQVHTQEACPSGPPGATSLYTGPSGPFSIVGRPLPTPCRAKQPSLQDEDFRALALAPVGMTLLEESVTRADSPAMFLAATLLDTIIEHLRDSDHERVAHGELAERRCLSLAASIHPTPFQVQAQALADIIPKPVRGVDFWGEVVVDWLDLDLSGLLAARTTPAKWRAVFQNLPTWWDRREDEPPQQLVIYTDGSAATRVAADVAPAAWAFAVWVRTPVRLLLLGFATHTAVPPFTPFSLGETEDTPLTAELLALAWALIWTLEFGAGLGLPVEFRYDCTSAGGGVFGGSPFATHAYSGGRAFSCIFHGTSTALRGEPCPTYAYTCSRPRWRPGQ